MSLGEFPTELDTRVCAYLQGDQAALDAMSRASKYYRGPAEPFLYRDLTSELSKK